MKGRGGGGGGIGCSILYYYSLLSFGSGLQPNQCPPSVAQVLACATDVSCFSLSVPPTQNPQTKEKTIHARTLLGAPFCLIFFFTNHPTPVSSSKDSLATGHLKRCRAWSDFRIFVVFFSLDVFPASFGFTNRLVFEGTLDWALVFSLVVVVVLLYLTVRAALGKRKSVETSWAAIIEFCAAANWRWRAYYFFVSDRQRGTEMMEMDCALSREILSTFSYFAFFCISFYSLISDDLFVPWFFTLLFAFKFLIIFLWSLFLFSRARAEKIKYFFHGKPSGP